jgi:uncharacterized protein YeaO (DUF488 family)
MPQRLDGEWHASNAMKPRLKRAYEAPAEDDGKRILVDRLWPRGLSREKAAIDVWLKDVAPSTELRRWFGHDPDRWKEFERRYFAELDEHPEAVEQLRAELRAGRATLVYGAKDGEHSNARALLEYLGT